MVRSASAKETDPDRQQPPGCLKRVATFIVAFLGAIATLVAILVGVQQLRHKDNPPNGGASIVSAGLEARNAVDDEGREGVNIAVTILFPVPNQRVLLNYEVLDSRTLTVTTKPTAAGEMRGSQVAGGQQVFNFVIPYPNGYIKTCEEVRVTLTDSNGNALDTKTTDPFDQFVVPKDRLDGCGNLSSG